MRVFKLSFTTHGRDELPVGASFTFRTAWAPKNCSGDANYPPLTPFKLSHDTILKTTLFEFQRLFQVY